MRYVVDPMTLGDIPRVIEIEKLAYPSPWPPSAYRKEIQDNRYARYIVVRDTERQSGDAAARQPARRSFPLSLLPSRPAPSGPPDTASIIAFAGLWLTPDEAHVTTIAVHPQYRSRGVGELMLSTLIRVAGDMGARMVTLEVRVSNYVAQSLYRKYGFHDAGVRRRYYSDNHEDALIMWTDEINSAAYRLRYGELTRALETRLSAREAGGVEQRNVASGDG
ncbi:MAG TPA: ribosomal protein S18-alanine N-acetyltransferase [Ktedonobacterales bacterium]|nr:ribosomal protein S18-alanine N-acetyltransferase [Ktedonobacterales bacterium]